MLRAASTIAARSTLRLDAKTRVLLVSFDDLHRRHRRPIGRRASVADIHESLGDCCPQLGQITGCDNVAAVDDDDVLADVLDQIELVAREQDRAARGGDLGKQRGHVRDCQGIETRERFVEHEQIRIVHESSDELYALLIAVRQRVDAIVPSVRETEPLEPPIDAPADLFAAPAAQPAQIQELVAYPHAGIEAALLGHVPEP